MLERLTPVTKNLILINVILYIALVFILPSNIYVDYFVLHKATFIDYTSFSLQRASNDFLPMQIVTYFFNHSHSDLFHIIFNMLVLGMFGPMCERVIGSKRFFNFYMFCGVVAGIILAFISPWPGSVVGASTATSGVLVAFAMAFPNSRVGLFFLPISFKAREFVIGIAVISGVLVLLQILGINIGGNISHFGHLAGMFAAYIFFRIEKYLPLPK